MLDCTEVIVDHYSSFTCTSSSVLNHTHGTYDSFTRTFRSYQTLFYIFPAGGCVTISEMFHCCRGQLRDLLSPRKRLKRINIFFSEIKMFSLTCLLCMLLKEVNYATPSFKS